MAKKIAPVAVNVNDEVKAKIDAYGAASAAKKIAEETMTANKGALVSAATETYNAHMREGVKSVNMSGNEFTAQIQFKASFILNTNTPAFETAKNLPCITSEKSICIRADKAAEVLQFLQSLGRADLLVETTAYTFNRTVFDAMEEKPTYAGRDELLACLEEKSIPTVTTSPIE